MNSPHALQLLLMLRLESVEGNGGQKVISTTYTQAVLGSLFLQ